MISIIIPVYNQGKILAKCLTSINYQTYENYEIIIVNDRSQDKLSKTLIKYKKIFGHKLEVIHNQENHGAPYSRNKGFKHCQGEFILFCDADIIMEPNMLYTLRQALKENSSAGYAYSSFIFGHKLFKLWPFDEEKLKKMPYIHTTSLIKREDFPTAGWDEAIKKFQDWDLWLTMLAMGRKGVFVDQVLFKVKSGGSMSSWLPSFAYKLAPFLPSVKKYKQAYEIIKKKHQLD